MVPLRVAPFRSVTGAPFAEPKGPWAARALVPAYEAYRLHQARVLLALLPPEGLRALYGAAREGRAADGSVSDPMELLDAFIDRHLPLPPFHVWCHDVRTNPGAHLDEPWMADLLPERVAPAVVAKREETLRGEPWTVELRVYHTGDGWHGHLAFVTARSERVPRTGDILREADAASAIERFTELDRSTLEAFLRSITP